MHVENLSRHGLLLHQPSRLTNTSLFLKVPSLTCPLRFHLQGDVGRQRHPRNGRYVTAAAQPEFISRLSGEEGSTPRHISCISRVELTQKAPQSDAIPFFKMSDKSVKKQRPYVYFCLHNNQQTFGFFVRLVNELT